MIEYMLYVTIIVCRAMVCGMFLYFIKEANK